MTPRKLSITPILWAFLASAAATASAQADPPAGPQVATPHGVSFTLPARFEAVPELVAAPALQATVAQAFSDGGDMPVHVFVLKASPPQPIPSMGPSRTVSKEYTRGLVESLRATLGLLDIQRVTPGAYDPARGMLSVVVASRGPSHGAQLLSLPDEHPAWAQLQLPKTDAAQIRCLVTGLLGGRPHADDASLRANSASAATQCSVPKRQVETFVASTGAAPFAPTESTLTSIAFFTRTATVHIIVGAPLKRAAAAESVATEIQQHALVSAHARSHISAFEAVQGTQAFGIGQLVGAVLGAIIGVLLIGGLFAWLLARLGLSSKRAVFVALACLVSLVVVASLQKGGPSPPAGLQVLAYVLTSTLAFRPLERWVRGRSLSASTGDSAVDHAK